MIPGPSNLIYSRVSCRVAASITPPGLPFWRGTAEGTASCLFVDTRDGLSFGDEFGHYNRSRHRRFMWGELGSESDPNSPLARFRSHPDRRPCPHVQTRVRTSGHRVSKRGCVGGRERQGCRENSASLVFYTPHNSPFTATFGCDTIADDERRENLDSPRNSTRRS